MFVNINKLYKYSKRIDNKQQYKATIEAYMESTPEGITKNSPMDEVTLVNLNKTSARDFLSQCLALLNSKQENSVLRMGYYKTKFKVITTGTYLPPNISKWIRHTQINSHKKALYKKFLHHPKFVQSKITNDRLKVCIDGQPEKQLIPMLSFHVSVR